ncbi:hypothetical protein C2G38_419568 [Gigaspora rosea]|uniref:SAM domain-containing protein n=1 Tax=Gigaspora rosea TaxID=44941 RepID=A0A397UBD1_9GLOM|nr:hypothetical protein C2G38_419568 [Gigaspora rosea]
MSTFANTSTAEQIKKLKKTDDLINFLSKQDLSLEEEQFQVLRKQKITGVDFLDLTKEELEKYGFELGPAKRVLRFINTINGEGEGQKKEADVNLTKISYYQKYENEHSEASDKEIRSFMDFILLYVPEHPKGSYEDVVKTFKESQEKTNKIALEKWKSSERLLIGISKTQVIFLKGSKIS